MSDGGPLDVESGGNLVLHLEPRQRQELPVGHAYREPDVLPPRGARCAQPPFVVHAGKAVPRPEQLGAADEKAEHSRKRQQRLGEPRADQHRSGQGEGPPAVDHGASTGTSASSNTAWTTASADAPRRRPPDDRTSRCASVGPSSTFTSSGITKSRPSSSAHAWQAR